MKIPLTRGLFALVDADDYDFIMQWKWMACDKGYAVRSQQVGRKNSRGINKKIFMHRLVACTPDGMDTDHINGIKADNRKENLRICTRQQNVMNYGARKTSSSKYRGVKWNKKLGKWQASISIERKKVHLGVFLVEEDAATAWNFAASQHHGEYAKMNKAA